MHTHYSLVYGNVRVACDGAWMDQQQRVAKHKKERERERRNEEEPYTDTDAQHVK